MATWKDIAKYTYKDKAGELNAELSLPSGKVQFYLQYDADSATCTSINVRFKYNTTSTLHDGMGVLYDADDGNGERKFYIVKGPTKYTITEFQYYSEEFTIYKKYSDEYFTIQDYYICNTGTTAVTKSADDMYDTYTTGNWKNYCMVVAEQNVEIPGTVVVDGTKPSISITDNEDNTVTFSGNLGTNGTNNAMQSAGIYYTTDGTDPTESNTRKYITLTPDSGASYEKTIQIYKTCTVKAYAVCEYEYNTASCDTEEIAVTYYKALNDPGKPELLPSSFKNGRLVLKQDWEWHWEKATQVGNIVKDTADRLRFFVKKAGTDSFVNTRMRDPSSGNFLDKAVEIEPGKGDWIFDRDPDAGAMVMKPNQYDLKPGDQVQLAVTSIAKDGNNKLIYSNRMYSDVHTVLNAGVVQVRVDNEWKEGQVMVYVNSEWKEAESVNVNVDGVWKEAQ